MFARRRESEDLVFPYASAPFADKANEQELIKCILCAGIRPGLRVSLSAFPQTARLSRVRFSTLNKSCVLRKANVLFKKTKKFYQVQGGAKWDLLQLLLSSLRRSLQYSKTYETVIYLLLKPPPG